MRQDDDGYLLNFHGSVHRSLMALSIICLTAAITACGGESVKPTQPRSENRSPTVAGRATDTPQMTADATAHPDTLYLDWSESPHADSYVLDENGENSRCARCHSPVQWIPSMEDLPESCSSCKFEVDPPPPVIASTDWSNVECKVCHEERKGEIQAEVLWLEIAAIEEYAQISSHTELCQKCHLASEIPGHTSIQVQGDHAGYVCTECHDAHTTAASCTGQGCHEEVFASAVDVPGHDQDHASLRCEACHDGAGLEVGLEEDSGEWVTYTGDISGAGDGDFYPFVSHNIQLEVDCTRCHYADNPWGLSAEVSTP